MSTISYTKFNNNQLDKIGNTAIYLSQKIQNLGKTKFLKLIYILDEISIKKSGIPFFNIKYKVWKFGPVSEELYIDLSSEPKLLEKYIEKNNEDGITIIKAISDFNDDEFSDNDIELMDFVINKYGNSNSNELINYTHRENSPWYITAKENGVLDLLETQQINNTDFIIDMSLLIAHDLRKKEIYSEFVESFN